MASPPSRQTHAAAASEQKFQLAHALYAQQRLDEAADACRAALALAPHHAGAAHLLGVVALQTNRPQDAAACFAKAKALEPNNPTHHSNHGLALLGMGQIPAAIQAFDDALKLRADIAEVHCSRADALLRLGRPAEALEGYSRAAILKPELAEAHCGRGSVLRPTDAAAARAAFETALARDPTYAEARYGLALSLQDLGMSAEALAAMDVIAAAYPALPDVHYARGIMLADLNRHDDARAADERALTLAPKHADARRSLFRLRLGDGDMPSLARLADEMAAETTGAEIAALKDRPVAAFRLRHDLEQVDWLATHGYAVEGLADVRPRLESACARALASNSKEVLLSAEECAAIAAFRRQRFMPAPAPVQDMMNPALDVRAIEAAYCGAPTPVVVIDNFLSPEALNALRTFCFASTVWRREYVNGYLGAFAEDGFISAAHIQLAAELRERLPRVLADQRLEQLWGFKCDPDVATGINVHADFARTNLNFWITPDDCNLDLGAGGLLVYDKPAPASWTFKEYNHDAAAIVRFLKEQGAVAQRIPYRCNRAILFDSTLFHETDRVHFKPGYENRRINITCLFGRGGLRTY